MTWYLKVFSLELIRTGRITFTKFGSVSSHYSPHYLLLLFSELYDRARATLGSSGFEHVFVGECCKGGDVGGFHGWYHYYLLEREGEINYLGSILAVI